MLIALSKAKAAEALSCGIPVVVSDKTAWKDIEKNKCGILAANEKVSFCKALNQIKNDCYRSEDCKNYVKNNFDWKVVSEKFKNLITED